MQRITKIFTLMPHLARADNKTIQRDRRTLSCLKNNAKGKPKFISPRSGALCLNLQIGVILSMQFIQSDLDCRQKGEVVEITLHGNAANVRLLDSANFESYKNGKRHTYHGGGGKTITSKTGHTQ